MNIRDKVITALETVGYVLPQEEDFDIRDYIFDSINFVAFILELEEQIGFSLPDEMLNIDVLSSFNGFVEMIIEIAPTN